MILCTLLHYQKVLRHPPGHILASHRLCSRVLGSSHIHVGDIVGVNDDTESKRERKEFVVIAITRRTGMNNPQPLIWYSPLDASSLVSSRAPEFKKYAEYKSQFYSLEKRIPTSLWNEHSLKWLADIGRREKQSFKGKTNRTLHYHSPPQSSSSSSSSVNDNQGNK